MMYADSKNYVCADCVRFFFLYGKDNQDKCVCREIISGSNACIVNNRPYTRW